MYYIDLATRIELLLDRMLVKQDRIIDIKNLLKLGNRLVLLAVVTATKIFKTDTSYWLFFRTFIDINPYFIPVIALDLGHIYFNLLAF